MPEIKVRKEIWSLGKRYRIHNRSVVGTPDISVKKQMLAVFIDGCFWHGCKRCYKEPKTNSEFWRKKILRNMKRRWQVRNELRADGWNILEFWEHEIDENLDLVINKIMSYK